MRFAPVLALACLVLPAVAEGAVVSYSAPASGAEVAVVNTIPAFDPLLRTLERVQLRLTGTVSDSFAGRVRQPGDPTGQDGAPTLDMTPQIVIEEFDDLYFGLPACP